MVPGLATGFFADPSIPMTNVDTAFEHGLVSIKSAMSIARVIAIRTSSGPDSRNPRPRGSLTTGSSVDAGFGLTGTFLPPLADDRYRRSTGSSLSRNLEVRDFELRAAPSLPCRHARHECDVDARAHLDRAIAETESNRVAACAVTIFDREL